MSVALAILVPDVRKFSLFKSLNSRPYPAAFARRVSLKFKNVVSNH